MSQTIADSAQTIAQTALIDTAILDASVEDVLGLMLGVPVTVADEAIVASAIPPITLTAVIGLAGSFSGAYTVLVTAPAATKMAGCLMGMEVEALDDSVYDGLGEIANMLAGAWKSRIPALNGSCFLSVPTVVTGTQYEVRKRSSAFRFTRSYRFDDHVFTVTIHGETP
ncbi:MAG TPA: chemotaxis protein CheX [Edaphobacter sp.]